MRLDPKSTIAGMPAKEVRDELRRMRQYICMCDGIPREGIINEWTAEPRNGGMKRARSKLPPRHDPTDALLENGIIEPIKDAPWLQNSNPTQYYTVTDYGRRIAVANLLPPLSRAKAETIMTDFLRRVAEANTNEEFCARITKNLCVRQLHHRCCLTKRY